MHRAIANHGRRMRWLAVGLLILAPLIMVPLTGMNWGIEDLAASTLLLGGAGLAYELALKLGRGTRYRIAAAAVIAFAFLLIWAELAVGVF